MTLQSGNQVPFYVNSQILNVPIGMNNVRIDQSVAIKTDGSNSTMRILVLLATSSMLGLDRPSVRTLGHFHSWTPSISICCSKRIQRRLRKCFLKIGVLSVCQWVPREFHM